MERTYPKLTLTPKGERAVRGGHPWVYGQEVSAQEGLCTEGCIVDVLSPKGRWLGAGFYNSTSKIRVRILSRNANDRYDEAYWRRKLEWAVQYRKTVMGADFAASRLIFGEADGFPGFTADLFGDVLVTEVLCLGIDRIKTMLYAFLRELLQNEGITLRAVYERSDSALRDKEGLERYCGFWDAPGLETGPECFADITENGLSIRVDCVGGQKTGFFLDQKYNRLAAARLAPGKKVLDCFTHTGAFALNCAYAGAASVTAVDISADALESAKANAALNGLSISFVQADVFDYLTAALKENRKDWDYIILDPPAFTKSSATVAAAYKGYKDINYRAMRLLPRGGYLATCSCSHFMTENLFRQMVKEAADDAGVSLRQIEARQQSPDHPILVGVQESDYLKFFLYQVV